MSPGSENISSAFIKHLPDQMKIMLHKTNNNIWVNKYFPQLWSMAIVIPILKPNDDKFETVSYRPTALTRVVQDS